MQGNNKQRQGARAQVGPDPYWGAAGLVGTSSAAPGTQLDNNTVAAPFGGIAVTAFGQAANLPPAQLGKSAHVNVTGAPPPPLPDHASANALRAVLHTKHEQFLGPCFGWGWHAGSSALETGARRRGAMTVP